MTDYLWPVDIIPGSQEWRVVDNVGTFQSPLSGSVRTVARPGARMACTITVPPVKGVTRARIMAVLGSLRGRSNRILITDYSTTRRGSLSSPEMLTNNDFSGGTTGLTGFGGTVSVTDLVARLTTSAGGSAPQIQQSVALTQYAPFAIRSFIGVNRGMGSIAIGPAIYDGTNLATDYSLTRGLRTASLVSISSSSQVQSLVVVNATSGHMSGDFTEVAWSSLTRCGLVDNGQNLSLYSDQIDNAAWTKSACTITANAAAAPDGTTTADAIVESNTSATHAVFQLPARASAVAEVVSYGFFKRGSGTRDIRIDCGDGASNFASCIFDLGAGTAGSVTLTGTATNGRASVVSVGGSWYFCSLVAHVQATATILCEAVLINAGSGSYLGNGTSSVYAWRMGCAVSGVATRGSQTTSAGTSGASQTGNGLYVKGLLASTAGLLKAGDPVQVGTQFNFVTAPLDTDAAGKGYLQCALPWRVSPADNDPVIFNTPMAKMILASDDIGWDTGPGQFSGFTLELIEDVT